MLERMEELIRAEQLLPRGSRVLCAVSGGADSVCLLAALYRLRDQLGFTLSVAHYNHQLRGEESLRDENFVRELVKKQFPGVELYVDSGDVRGEAEARRSGLEETARVLRYAFLRRTAQACGADRIATAHTADDNAETILLHLCRGTGLQGLTGIAPIRGEIIRPLLTTTRVEVEACLAQWGLPHVEDSSNAEDRFARNRIRHQVIPVLEGLYPGFAARMTEQTSHLRRDEAYLSDQAGALAAQARFDGKGLTIPVEQLTQAPLPIGVRAVRRLLAELRGGDDTCAAVHLESVLALCRSGNVSGEVHLPDGMVAQREYGRLRLCRMNVEPMLEAVPLNLPGITQAGGWEMRCTPGIYRGEHQTGQDFWLSKAQGSSLLVRSRQTGDTLKLPGRPGKSVKKWLVDEKVPRRIRDGLPVFVAAEQVAAVVGLGPDVRWVPQPGEEAWHFICKSKPVEG